MAGQFTWTFDAASGVFKSHTLSEKLRFAAVADTKFVQFCRPEPGFGKKKGETVTIERIRNITVPTSAVLTESTRIPVDTFLMSTRSITVAEYGRAVEYTSLVNDLSKWDLESPIQRKLRDQMKLVMDIAASAAFRTAKLLCYPTSASALTWQTDGLTTGHYGLNNLTVAHLGIIRDAMQDTYHIPMWEGDTYMGIMSTKALRGIKSDPDFLAWRQYLNPGDVLYKSEVGQIESIRMVECNYTSSLGAVGTGSVLGEGMIFGDDAVAMVEVETPELRAAIPGDFGRSKAVAWYGVLAFGIVWDTANDGEARVIRITSATN
jgi:N4-gp56 family major capsid protein